MCFEGEYKEASDMKRNKLPKSKVFAQSQHVMNCH